MNSLEKEFPPYEEALELKELGFDEPCFAWYDSAYQNIINYDQTTNSCGWLNGNHCTAPTFSQAFRWLLKNHYLYGIVIPTITMNWAFKTMTVVEGIVEVPPYKHVNAYDYSTHEEAELACLRKLIEIVKSKQ